MGVVTGATMFSFSSSFAYGVRKWTKLPTPFRGVAAPLLGPITSPCRRFYFVVASRFRCVVFLFHRGVVFSFRRFYFVVASCFRFVIFLFRRRVKFGFVVVSHSIKVVCGFNLEKIFPPKFSHMVEQSLQDGEEGLGY